MTQLVLGAQIASYRLERVLGSGGMGIVYLARGTDGVPVVLKILKSELSDDASYRHRFDHEARIAREVQHPSLVPIIESGEADGHCYIAMPFVGAQTLGMRIADFGPLPLAEVLRIAVAIGNALNALHERGLIHRDVKPSNVILNDADGSPSLTDFGIAKGVGYTVLTRTGQIVGTMDYLAPELIRGANASRVSDIYAMACLLYECVVGTPPFSQRPLFQVCYAHLQDPPPDPRLARSDLSPEFATALLKGLEKEPDERPPEAGTYARLLRLASKLPAATTS
jgi:serine/threonine protein kinase